MKKIISMANIDNLNNLILRYYDANVINDVDILLLHDVNRVRNPHFPYWRYDKFDLDLMSADECKADFWMWKDDVYTLVDIFGFPAQFKCYKGVVDSVEATCICLRRLAYPCRYSDLIHRFARPVPQLSMISNLVINKIYQRHDHLLRSIDQPWLSRENLAMFANAVHRKGGALDNCWVL